jgi:DNA-binding LacI/PurR family transcriptional regulator
MLKKRHRSTLHDIADHTGVSYQTVSRVINNHPNVAPETRERVQRAIVKLGYRPNKVAQSLVAQQSNTLAVLGFSIDQYGPAQMVLHIERAAKSLGYDLIFSNVSESTPDQIRKALDSLIGRRVDGILSISPVPGLPYAEMVGLCPDIPIVQIDPEPGANVPAVMFDQHYGSQMISDYLIKLGHHQISEISGPLHWFDARARHQQWETTLLNAGLIPGASVAGDWTAAGGYQAARRLLTTDMTFTALVVGNDQMALGAMRALREANRRIPEDISVVGFDDIPEAEFFEPPLTTVEQDFSQLGEIGVRYLLERLQQPDTPPQQHILYPKLVIRSSAAEIDVK